jgi:hypothetical protein
VELLLVPVGDEIRKGSMEEFLDDADKELLLVPAVEEIRKGSVEEILVEKVYAGSGGDSAPQNNLTALRFRDGDSSISSM